VQVARHVSESAFASHLASAMTLREEALHQELQEFFEQKLQLELKRRDELQELQWLEDARRNVIDNILTLACPRCRQAFVDFEGCFALTCSRCQCGFCAWCLEDCGSDAHQHVRFCRHNNNGQGELFGNSLQFEQAQQCRRVAMLNDHVRSQPEERRLLLLQSIETELLDLGLKYVVGKDIHVCKALPLSGPVPPPLPPPLPPFAQRPIVPAEPPQDDLEVLQALVDFAQAEVEMDQQHAQFQLPPQEPPLPPVPQGPAPPHGFQEPPAPPQLMAAPIPPPWEEPQEPNDLWEQAWRAPPFPPPQALQVN